MKLAFSVLFSFLLVSFSFAQKEKFKWGKVSKEDLKMTSYTHDPNADAVVLADIGNLRFDLTSGSFRYSLERHVRIKLFKKSAFDNGDISIPFYHYDNMEKINNVKAQVILPDGKSVKVGNKDFFREETNKYWSRLKFAFPNLQEGCIIEYKYVLNSENIYYLTDWYFQREIPTRWSELRTNIPEWFDYISFRQGLPVQEETSTVSRMINVPRDNGSFGRSQAGRNIEAQIVQKRYYLEHVPAIKPEQFITTMRDYYAKLSLQLQSVKFPNSIRKDMTSSWTDLAQNLEKDDNFGNQYNKSRHTKKLKEAVLPQIDNNVSDLEKTIAIYSYLSNNIKWNEFYGFTSNSLDAAFEKGSANSGELNLMLIALCRELGIEAYPVLISTRSHGRMLQHYPKTDQFNHTLAFIQAGDRQLLLDVGSPVRSPELIRMEAQNYMGWLVNSENPQWINITPYQDQSTTLATLALHPDGKLTGSVKNSFKGYCAMRERTEFYENKQKDNENLKEDWTNTFPDAKLASINYENEKKASEALKYDVEIELPEAAQVNDPYIYLSPMIGKGLNENPLKLEKRIFPVDIPVKSKEQFILNLSIPDGYEVEELPENMSVKTEDKGASFQYRISQTGNNLQVISKMTINKLHYEPEEYAIIRNFFIAVVEKHGEQIVLKKIVP